MRVIEQIIEIDAPASRVWDVLLDVERYPEWNPFLTISTPPTHVGQRLAVTTRVGRRTMRFSPEVTVFEPGRSLCWRGRLLAPRVFDGAHELRVERVDEDRSRFIHRETFRGVLVPFVRSALRDTEAAFAAMNSALAARARSYLPANTCTT